MTSLDHRWGIPPADIVLSSHEVHIWRAPLELPASCVQSLQHTLSSDELSRAASFYAEKDQRRFIVARGVLRAILSRYLDMEPRQFRFCYSSYGKPALVTASREEKLCFNLSHSCALVLYAVTCNREVGLDIEHMRANFAYEEIAERFFSPQENATLRALPAHLQHEAFFNCWTRKEAYIKAHGEGLSMPLDEFDVSLAPGEPAALLTTRRDPQEASRWSLRELAPGPGYVAALAVEGYSWRLACWQWLG